VKDETGVYQGTGLAGCARRACPVGTRARFQRIAITARHTTKVGNTRSRWPNPQGREPSKVGFAIGVKS
jgi:hypothetical protein